MKKQRISSAALRLLFASALFGFASLAKADFSRPHLLSPPSQADSIDQGKPVVSFIGSDEEYYYFRIQVNNQAGTKHEVVIRDRENGTILYSDAFSTNVFMKRIAVPRDITQLQWDVQVKPSKGKAERSTWSLTTEVKLREDVFVTRL